MGLFSRGSKSKNKKKKKVSTRKLRLVAGKDAPFRFVESYKELRTNLNFVLPDEKGSCIAVTSSVPEEGKSNVAINLAVTLGANEKSVLLVDCDLRKPILHRYLKLEHSESGLSALLSGRKSIDECIFKFKNLNICVITAGTIPPNPSELLEKGMPKLLESVKDKFDYIILDTPPVSLVTDAAVLGRMTDGVILVVRSKFATREVIKLAKQKLKGVGVNIFGVVLNQFDERNSHTSSGYSYSYQYDYYSTDENTK